VLDEPTNHLDLEAIQALVEGLKSFKGTILFVSHDRWFVSELASRIVELTPQGPRDFPGTYNEYIERCGDDHLDADAVVLKQKRSRQAALAADSPGSASWDEQKRRRNRLKELPIVRDRVLAEIEAVEARKRAILDLYASPGFFERASMDEVAALEKEQSAIGPRLDALMADWEELEREISSLQTGD
jgi:energy-coupling factor transporter ATP-binding protein EcfA2